MVAGVRDWYGVFFFFQAEDGIRDLVRSRGLGDVYKRQDVDRRTRRRNVHGARHPSLRTRRRGSPAVLERDPVSYTHLTLPTIYPV